MRALCLWLLLKYKKRRYGKKIQKRFSTAFMFTFVHTVSWHRAHERFTYDFMIIVAQNISYNNLIRNIFWINFFKSLHKKPAYCDAG